MTQKILWSIRHRKLIGILVERDNDDPVWWEVVKTVYGPPIKEGVIRDDEYGWYESLSEVLEREIASLERFISTLQSDLKDWRITLMRSAAISASAKETAMGE